MEKQRQIKEAVLDELVKRAVEDLYKSGLDNEEIFHIVEEQFGLQYARKLCEDASNTT